MGMKGMVLTLDAIVAMTIMVSVVSLLILFRTDSSSPFYTAQQLHSLSEDMLTILSESTLEEVISNQTLLYDLNQSENLSDIYWNDKAIEVIGKLWAENKSEAAMIITKDILGNILPGNIGYQVLINGYDVYNSSGTNRTKYEDATTEISSNRIASGYQKGENVTGCVARAYLKSIRKNDSSYLYFGGYVGDGNITVNIALPPFDNILEAYMELDAGGDFNLYINDNYAGNYSSGTAGGGLMKADKWVVCNKTYKPSYCSNFTQGNNTLKINFTGNNSFIGGGYFRVTYNTTLLAPQQEPGNDTYWFPGIAGFFNLYDSLYVPGTLKNMTSYLHYFNNFTLNETNATVYLSIGSVAVFRSNETGNVTKYLNFSDIWKNFSSSQNLINNVSNETVPLRFGIEGFQLKPGVGTADAVLITDVSGSMDTFQVSCSQDSAWRISALDCQGNYSAQNRKTDDSQSNCMYRNVTLSSSGRIYFRWKVSSQSGDRLRFYIDGSQQQTITGTVNWATVNYAISSGNHEIRWCYTKDNGGSSNDDTGYVDSIVVNTSGTIFFSDNFESGVLNGWSFYSSGTTCEKLDSAKIVDKTFVDTVLDTLGDRVGLVSFQSTLSGTHPLSNNSCTLKGNITAYSHDGSTCTSCGISNATIILDAAKNPLRFQGLLLMSDGYANQCFTGANSNDCGVFGGPVNGNAASPDPNYPAKLEAINMSCTARSKNYTVFSVGFGSSADSLGLQRIACWNCSACRVDCNGFPIQASCPSQCYWNSTHPVNNTAFHSTFDSVSTSTNCSGVTAAGWTDCVAGESTLYWRAYSGASGNSSSARFFRGDDIDTANATWITKCLDLSSYTKAYLSFDWSITGLVSPNQYILVRVNKTGSPNLKDLWYSGSGTFPWAHTEMNVTNNISSNTCFRVYCALANNTNQYCDLDDFKIIGTYPGKCEILNDSSCWIGNVTNPLDGTQADCKDVRYAQSDDLDQLTQIYQGFGQMFVNLGYTTQRANLSSNMKVNNILYPDSHIDLQYSPVIIPSQYGEVSLTVESPRLGDLTDYNITKPYKEGWFNVSDKVRVVDAEMTSYSSDYWTDMLWLNSSATGSWKEVYNLTYWGDDYTMLGDPFIIHLPVNNVSSGNNSVRIETGLCPNNSAICKLNKTGGSPDDRVIYTVMVNGSVGYGNVNKSCEGAKGDAIQRLKDLMGSFSITGDIEAESSSISSVPYMWGPASVKVSVWS